MRRKVAGVVAALMTVWPLCPSGPIFLSNAAADTPEFPDLDGYTWTSPDWFFRHGARPMTAEFSTPDGLYCWVSTYLETRYGCDGHLPGAPAGVNSVRVQHGKPAQFLTAASHDIPGGPAMDLEPDHYFNDAGTVCLVDDEGMTACGYGDHGFILKPSGSVVW